MINLSSDYWAALGVFLLTWAGLRLLLAVAMPLPKDLGRLVSDRVLNLFFVFVVVWKLSPLLFQFSTVVREPSSLLYLPGGSAGVGLGVVAALAFGIWGAVAPGKKVPADNLKKYRKAYFWGGGLLGVLGLSAILLAPLMAPKPEQAPDFTLADASGQEFSLHSFQGRTVVLNFWASWCPPCRAEFPQLEEFAQNQGAKADGAGAVLLGINATSTEPSLAAARDFLAGRSESFPHLWDTLGEVQKLYGVTSLPTTVVIDGEGRVVSRRTGAVTAGLLEEIISQ